RLPGVAGITYLGQRDYSMRAWLDPDKLAALRMSAMDVVIAIAQQNVQVAAGQIGQPPVPSRAQQFQLTINTLGRLTDPEQFADIIVKGRQPPSATPPAQASPDGSSASDMLTRPTAQSTGIVRLRDVVRENRYYVRIQFDADKLAYRKLHPADVVRAMNPQPRSIHEDPEFPTPGVEPLIWRASSGGAASPR